MGFQSCSSHLGVFQGAAVQAVCVGEWALLALPLGTAALAGAGGSHCSHRRALSSPKFPQAKSSTLSNGLLPELSHKKFNVF